MNKGFMKNQPQKLKQIRTNWRSFRAVSSTIGANSSSFKKFSKQFRHHSSQLTISNRIVPQAVIHQLFTIHFLPPASVWIFEIRNSNLFRASELGFIFKLSSAYFIHTSHLNTPAIFFPKTTKVIRKYIKSITSAQLSLQNAPLFIRKS